VLSAGALPLGLCIGLGLKVGFEAGMGCLELQMGQKAEEPG